MTDLTSALRPYDPDRVTTIAVANNRHEKYLQNTPLPLAEFFERILGKVKPRLSKDGTCYVAGNLFNGRRSKLAVTSKGLLVYDVETGQTMDEVADLLDSYGLAYSINPTYSHMQEWSSISEAEFDRAHRDLVREDPQIPARQIVVETLVAKKGFHRDLFNDTDDILADIKRERRDESGVRYWIRHKPMERFRVAIPLAEELILDNWSHNGQLLSTKDAAELWSEVYNWIAGKLGIEHDRTSADPSRLNYTPAIPHTTSFDPDIWGHIASLTPGTQSIDFVAAARLYQAERDGAAPEDLLRDETFQPLANASRKDFKTPGLAKFLKQHGADFQIVQWVQEVFPEDVRGSGVDKCDMRCPNDDAHSNAGDPEDRAFCVGNADGSTGFWAACQHGSCADLNDRAIWLDMLVDRAIREGRIAGVEALHLYCLLGHEEAASEEVDGQAPKERSDEVILQSIRSEITKFSTETPLTEVEGVLLRLMTDQIPRPRHGLIFAEIRAKTKISVPDLRDMYERVIVENTLPGDDAGGHTPPTDVSTYDGPVLYGEWDYTTCVEIVKSRLVRWGRNTQSLFNMGDAPHMLRLHKDPIADAERVRLTPMRSQGAWMSALNHASVSFIGTEGRGIAPPVPLLTELTGTQFDFQSLLGVTTVPQYGKSGTLHTAAGYNPETLRYKLPDPQVDHLASILLTPDASPEHVAEMVSDALNFLLAEAFRDFPLADYGDDADYEVYTDEIDMDGSRIPNWERGRSSRANLLAMVMHPFVRPMISGPTPIMHIDKALPGSGAGYLTNTITQIFSGETAEVSTFGSDNEFRKFIVGQLQKGVNYVFFDNVTGTVDSPELAKLITAAPYWSTRVLGSNSIATIPITQLFILAGNDIILSDELNRRTVPVRIDPRVPNPARRPLSTYKHPNQAKWVAENREALVWAVLTLIQAWINAGAPKGSKSIGTFEEWAQTMSGILEHAQDVLEEAGIPDPYRVGDSFLDNIDGYSETRNADVAGGPLGTILFKEFGYQGFNSSAVITLLQDPMNADVTSTVPDLYLPPAGIAPGPTHTMSVGKAITTYLVDKPFEYDHPDGGKITVTLRRTKSRGKPYIFK